MYSKALVLEAARPRFIKGFPTLFWATHFKIIVHVD